MLDSIHVKNLALISEAEAELKEGLNILSGETGAGKSIIIDSISIALGEKTTKGFIREGEKEGLVELVFSGIPKELKDYLDSRDITAMDDTVILTRKLSENRSIAKINGESVSAGILKEAAGFLIDIHGQHEHQSLLREGMHLRYLDKFGGEAISAVKDEVSSLYHDLKQVCDELDANDISDSERIREIDLLKYEIDELEGADLKEGEDEELEDEYRRLKNYDRIFAALSEASEYLSGDGGVTEAIGRASKALSQVAFLEKEVSDIYGQLAELSDLCDGAVRDIASYTDRSGFDAEHFDQVEKRLDIINRLKDKYGNTIEAVNAQTEVKRDRLSVLMNLSERVDELKKRKKELTDELTAQCEKLSALRKKTAGEMKERLIKELCELNFLDVRFDIEFEKTKDFRADGYDAVRFLISLNPGEPLKELSKIASGGEISRIMLGMKSMMADSDSIDTLIFDEIDTGISGETANRVAKKMKDIADRHQVICITHLPQIAAAADHHFMIRKGVNEGVTTSNISLLSDEESVSELARMIGGDDRSENIMDSAREMKAKYN